MDRMTTDNEKHGLFFLNTFYGKDGQVWVRGGGPAPGYEDCTLVDFMSRAATPLGLSLDEEDPETVGEIMYDNLQFGPMECEGVLGFLWLAAGQAAEMRGRLKMIENILGDNYDLDRLRELVESDRDGRCVVLPFSAFEVKDSNMVWIIEPYEDDEPEVAGYVLLGMNGQYAFLSPQINGEKDPHELCAELFSSFYDYDEAECVVVWPIDQCYPTKEAAEAALKGEQDG